MSTSDPNLQDKTVRELRFEYEELQAAYEELRIQNESLLLATTELANERERYRRLYENSLELLITTDANGRILDANKAATGALDIAPEYLKYKVLASLMPTEHRKDFRARLAKLKNEQDRFAGKIILQPRKSAAPIVFDTSAEAIRGRSTSEIEIHWVMRTQRKNRPAPQQVPSAEELAQAGNPDLRQLQISRESHVALWDHVNPATILELLASSAAEMVGQHCFISLLSRDKKYLVPITAATRGQKSNGMVSTYKKAKPQSVAQNIAEQVLKTGHPRIITSSHIKSSALAKVPVEQGPVDMMIVPLRSNREVIGLLTLIRESGTVCFSEKDLQPVQSLADHASSLILNLTLNEKLCDNAAQQSEGSELALNFCKDLQGPLHAILGYSAMLCEPQPDWSPEVVVQDAMVINKAATYVNNLVTELLEVTQMELGAVACRLERVALNEFISDIDLELFNSDVTINPQSQVTMDDTARGLHLKIDPIWARKTVSAVISFARQISENIKLKCQVTDDRLWLIAECKGITDEITDIKHIVQQEQGFIELDPLELLKAANSRTSLRMMFARRFCEVSQVEFKIRFPEEGSVGEVLMGFEIR